MELCIITQDEISETLERFDQAITDQNTVLAWRMAIKLRTITQRRRSEIRRSDDLRPEGFVEALDEIDVALKPAAERRSTAWDELKKVSALVHRIKRDW